MVPERRLPCGRAPSVVLFGLLSAAFWADWGVGEDGSSVNTTYNPQTRSGQSPATALVKVSADMFK